MLRERRISLATAGGVAGVLMIGAIGLTALTVLRSSSPHADVRAASADVPAPASVATPAATPTGTSTAAPPATPEAAPRATPEAAPPGAAAAATKPPAVSVVDSGVVVDVPVHPKELLEDARTAIRITRKILKQLPHVKILSISPRHDGGFTVRVLLTPRQTGIITLDKNLGIGPLVTSPPNKP